MNHPTHEEWMAFLYEDLEPADKSRLAAHLQSCDACRGQIQTWRATKRSLDAWQLPATRPTPARFARWAAAAAVLLVAGGTIGATLRPAPDLAAFQERLDHFAAENRALVAQLTNVIAENRLQDRESLVVTLRELETRRLAEMQSLRRDLETVAAQTENQFVRLAGYSGSANE